MVNLNGHEAGNGGYSQGTPTARRAFLYSESPSFSNPSERSGKRPRWNLPQTVNDQIAGHAKVRRPFGDTLVPPRDSRRYVVGIVVSREAARGSVQRLTPGK